MNGFDGRRDVLIGGDGSDLGRVDEGLESARGTERLLKIDPHDAAFHQHQGLVIMPYPWLDSFSFSNGMDIIQIPPDSGWIVVHRSPPTGSGTPRVGDLNLDGKITIAQFIAMAQAVAGSTPV